MTIGLLDHPASNLAPVHGTCTDEFATVRDVFADNVNTTRDIGASAAVFVDGECVVDLWGGYYDMTFSREWERHTIVQMFSNTKTLTALSALVLADRGVLDLRAPVAKYWPEFAENGKGDIEVRQLLNYSSGVAGWTEHMTLPEIYDVEKSTAMLARHGDWRQPHAGATARALR
jgi:CubicO group peptidase (beta-lactamase class C family)